MNTENNFNLNEQTGFLHSSKEKTSNESPDYFGSFKINGVSYALGGWTKQGTTSGVNYIALNLDLLDLSIDDRVKARKVVLKEFKADKKTTENKDKFLLINQTGALHIQSDVSKKEDFFGTVMIDGKIIYINGFMTTSKTGKSVVMLKVSDGMKTKDERTELASSFIG
jgi:hypothetical protein